MAKLITSQHYLDDAIVTAKAEAEDFIISVSPVFQIDGEDYQVLLDGHHSYAAAIIQGVEPTINELTTSEHDAIAWLDRGDAAEFLAIVQMDGDYRFADTGRDVW